MAKKTLKERKAKLVEDILTTAAVALKYHRTPEQVLGCSSCRGTIRRQVNKTVKLGRQS
jgi:hypothetical protein